MMTKPSGCGLHWGHGPLALICLLQGLAVVSCGDAGESSPEQSPDTLEPTWLFEGDDLGQWETYLAAPWSVFEERGLQIFDPIDPAEHIGWNQDPMGVFSLVEVDGERVIRISGEVYGALISREEFQDYHLRLSYRWGTLKWPPREELTRDSGLLYHSVGPAGVAHNAWMKSQEFQIEEGHTGDYYSVAAAMARAHATVDPESTFYVSDPNGEPVTFGPDIYYCQGRADFERPYGEWNEVDLYVFGAESLFVVNGQVANAFYDSFQVEGGQEIPLVRGKVQIQSEAAEIFYKDIFIEPIDELPPQ
jgi:hypothetical protein